MLKEQKNTSAGKLIFNNKYLLDYIYEFDNTIKEKFKNKLIFSKDILGAVHSYWFNRYENELKKYNANMNFVLELQEIYFDTLFLFDPDLTNSIILISN
jgi:ADP-glucose pyrophosphorylase